MKKATKYAVLLVDICALATKPPNPVKASQIKRAPQFFE